MNLRPALLGVALLAFACGEGLRQPSIVHFSLGVHRVAVEVPAGWTHLDHGSEHRFDRGLNRILIADHGPVTRDGFLRRLREAHGLFLQSRCEDARAHCADLDLGPLFPDREARKDFFRTWRTALECGPSSGRPTSEAEEAWSEILRTIAALEGPAIDDIVRDMLPRIDDATHREIAEIASVSVGSCLARRAETWDRLSHDHRRSFVLVLHDGDLLVLSMEMGHPAEMAPAFEAMAASLRVQSSSNPS